MAKLHTDDAPVVIKRASGYGLSWRGSGEKPRDYIMGNVRTPDGFVDVYSQPASQYAGDAAFTVMTFIHAGVVYGRRWQRHFGLKHLVTLAARFAREKASC